MNLEIKKKWVGALRSGKYKQGEKVLCTEYDEYCCLGVLCSLVTNKNTWELTNTGWQKRFYKVDGNGGLLSQRILDITGVDATKCNTLAGMNDNHKSFNEIANYIETNL